MARTSMKLGTWGEIHTTFAPAVVNEAGKVVKPERWRAYALYRGYDGHTSQVERKDTSQDAAAERLKNALQAKASRKSGATLTLESRLKDAADIWIDRIRRRRRGTTYDRYRSRLKIHILPALGELLLAECTVGRIEDFFDDLEDRGDLAAGTLRGIRTALSGVLQVAVRHDVFRHNPCRELETIEDNGRKRPKITFTDAELMDFLRKMDADKRAVRADLPDLIRFVFGTGLRFGEAIAVRWRDVNLGGEPIFVGEQEIPPGSLWVNGNIVAISGQGLVRHDGKTPKSNRILGMPAYLLTLLLVRRPADAIDDDPVFPSAVLSWRAPSGVQRAVRAMRTRIGYPDFTLHVGRRSVATALDRAGQSARQIADQLGHANPSMTQNVYMGRAMANPDAAKLLHEAHSRAA
jgi:integrase